MKRISLMLIILVTIFTACKSVNENEETAKAIEGEWFQDKEYENGILLTDSSIPYQNPSIYEVYWIFNNIYKSSGDFIAKKSIVDYSTSPGTATSGFEKNPIVSFAISEEGTRITITLLTGSPLIFDITNRTNTTMSFEGDINGSISKFDLIKQ